MNLRLREFVCDEEHSSVLPRWKQLGLRNAVVLSLDRHLDLKPIRSERLRHLVSPKVDLASIARTLPIHDTDRYCFGSDDFLFVAGFLSIASTIVWVMPDDLAAKQPHGVAGVLWENVAMLPGYGGDISSTFKSQEGRAQCSVAGLTIHACTAKTIPEELLKNHYHVDVDLDYFAAASDKQASKQVELVAERLSGLTASELNTATGCYSTVSGYLPRRQRFVGAQLGKALDCKFSPLQLPDCIDERVWRLISCDGQVATSEFEMAEGSEFVRTLGAAGQSLLSSLALRAGHRDEAERYWHSASRLGDRATWSAYRIALSYIDEGNYDFAHEWLSRVAYDLIDKLQVSAIVLLAVCRCRLNRFDEAMELATVLIDKLPLMDDGYEIAIACARAMGDKRRQREYESAMSDLQEMRRRKCSLSLEK